MDAAVLTILYNSNNKYLGLPKNTNNLYVSGTDQQTQNEDNLQHV